MKTPYCISLLLSALLCVVSNAQAEGFCTGEKLSQVEALICSDKGLLELDKSLNNIYNLILRSLPERQNSIKNNQRNWLKKIRNQCENKECLSGIYRDRLAELSEIFIRSVPVSEKPITNIEAKEICSSMAVYADTKILASLAIPGNERWSVDKEATQSGWSITNEEQASLNDRLMYNLNTVYKLRLKQNGPIIRFGRFFTGGTCASYEVYNIEHLTASKENDDGVDHVLDPEEEIRWAYWGGGDYPIFYHGRIFLVTADLLNPNDAEMISWVKPDGRKRPLCLLKVQSTKNIVVSAKDKDLCTGIAEGTILPMKWKKIEDVLPTDTSLYRDAFVKHYGNYADTLGFLNIDINGDGVSENIGHFNYASGAGCGSERNWMLMLTEDLGSIMRGPLNDLLSRLKNGPMNVYSYHGHYYLDGVEASKKPGIVKITNNEIQQVCEFEAETKREISRFFDIEFHVGINE